MDSVCATGGVRVCGGDRGGHVGDLVQLRVERVGVGAVGVGPGRIELGEAVGDGMGDGVGGGQVVPDVLVDAAVVVTGVGVAFLGGMGLGLAFLGRMGLALVGPVFRCAARRVAARRVVVTVVEVAAGAGLEQGHGVDRGGAGSGRVEDVVDELVVAAAVVDDEGRVADRGRVGGAGLVRVRVGGRLGDQRLHLGAVPGDGLRDRAPHVGGGDDADLAGVAAARAAAARVAAARGEGERGGAGQAHGRGGGAHSAGQSHCSISCDHVRPDGREGRGSTLLETVTVPL